MRAHALTDTTPPGGAWPDVVDSVREVAPEMAVLVCSPEPSSELRTLVRRRGAYYAEYEPYHPIAVQLFIRVALARRNRERHWGRKLYGHLFDDILKLKYLHQRYTNYLKWLQWKG